MEGGFKNFYNSWSDYLPGYLYILWLLGKINLLGIFPQVLIYKLPGIVADITTGFLIYKILQNSKGKKWGLVGALIYIFNPAVFANSALWGQVDSLTALCAVSAIYYLPSSIYLSSTVLAVGTLIKPQAAFIFPVILFLFIKKQKKLIDLLLYCFTGLVIFILAFVPFSNGNIFQFIFTRLGVSANQYPYTSVNAFNFWGLTGFWNPDNIYFQFGGYIFVFLLTIFIYIKSFKEKLSPYYLTAFIFVASFMFFTRMHERHLLPAFAPLAIIAVDNPIFLIPYVGFSLIYILNLIYSHNYISNDFVQVLPDFLIKLLIALGMYLLFFIFRQVLKNKKCSWEKILHSIKLLLGGRRKKEEVERFPKVSLSDKSKKMILGGILVFAFITRIYNLGSPGEMYFDEVYHAFTAKVMMGEDRAKAWEWWNTPPEGFAYEWTHPPLSKLGMVLGMSVFGQNPLGWRVPGAILGVGAVFLIYLLAKKIFKDEVVGLLSAAVFSLDGMSLVLNRMGMNDGYLLFFSLLAIYMFMKGKDFFSAIFYGLALASKWSALWAAPILFVLWLKRKNKFKPSVLWFLILPFAVYLLTYLPMFTTGHNLETWWGMQKQMWWYHTGLDATHPYTSSWWTWPLMIRPIYLYTSEEVGGMVSRIYAMGNPLVFWFGIISVVMCALYSYLERNKNLGFIVFCYLIFFAPWAASPRIMFIYHYLPSIPFMCIAAGYILRRNPKIISGYLIISAVLFVYFFPHWTGTNIPLWLDRSYYWITSWR